MPLTKKDLLKMLTYRRPAWSATEGEFIARYIDPVPGVYADKFGNRLLLNPDSRVMIACHTDTVHKWDGRQRVRVHKGIAQLPRCSTSNCLGADDTAGVYACLRLIEAGVKASFVFHRAEEIGGLGSTWLAYNHPEWLESFDVCLSLDRRGVSDIITSQFCGDTASTDFAWSLAEQLGMTHSPCAGIFTDSANYSELIPECSNISVGYKSEHTVFETLDLDYLERLIDALIGVDWGALAITRTPTQRIDWFTGFALDDLEDELTELSEERAHALYITKESSQ